MPNEKNLIPHRINSAKKARELGRQGGINSGESKRAKKTLKQITELMLVTKPTKEALSKIKKDFPEVSGQIDFKTLLVLGQIHKAVSKRDTKAVEFIRDIIGEKPIEKSANININAEYDNLSEEDLDKKIIELQKSINEMENKKE